MFAGRGIITVTTSRCVQLEAGYLYYLVTGQYLYYLGSGCLKNEGCSSSQSSESADAAAASQPCGCLITLIGSIPGFNQVTSQQGQRSHCSQPLPTSTVTKSASFRWQLLTALSADGSPERHSPAADLQQTLTPIDGSVAAAAQ